MSKPDALTELISPVAGVILTLMAHLSQCFASSSAAAAQQQRAAGAPMGAADPASYLALLDTSLPAVALTRDVSAVQCEPPAGSRALFALAFQVVLRGLLEHMIRCSQWFCEFWRMRGAE